MNTPLESCWKAFQIYCRGKQRERRFCWKKMSRVSWKIEKSVMQACRSFAATIFEISVTRDFFYVRLYRVCRVVAKLTKQVAFRAKNQNCCRTRYIVLNFESCSNFFLQATLGTRQTHKNQIYIKLFIHLYFQNSDVTVGRMRKTHETMAKKPQKRPLGTGNPWMSWRVCPTLMAPWCHQLSSHMLLRVSRAILWLAAPTARSQI